MRNRRTITPLAASGLILGALAITAAPAAGAGPVAPAVVPPVACGDVLTTDTTLTASLVCPTGDGLIIGADGITLDLNAQFITGAGVAGTIGVDNTGGWDDVTVEGGTITAFDSGIVNEFGHRFLVEGITVEGSIDDGIVLEEAYRSVVNRSKVNRSENGIVVVGAGPVLVSRSEVVENNRDGLVIVGNNVEVRHTTATANGDDGIVVVGDHNLIDTSGARDNGEGGVVIVGEDNLIESSAATGSGTEGFAVIGDKNRVVASIVRASVGNGILVVGAFNDVKRTTSADNLGDGVVVEAANDTRLHRVTATGNVNGFDVADPAAILSSNTSDDNSAWGFVLVPGVVDVGGNTATGNLLGQCDPAILVC